MAEALLARVRQRPGEARTHACRTTRSRASLRLGVSDATLDGQLEQARHNAGNARLTTEERPDLVCRGGNRDLSGTSCCSGLRLLRTREHDRK